MSHAVDLYRAESSDLRAKISELRAELADARHQLSQCDDIPLDQGLAWGIVYMQQDRERLRAEVERLTRWIPVSERLSEKRGYYMGCWKHKGLVTEVHHDPAPILEIHSGWTYGEDSWPCSEDMGDPTHWREKPPPPKGDE